MFKTKTDNIELISLIAHELRTPLTSVVGYLDVLRTETEGQLSDTHKQFFERALTSSKQLSFLVDNVLNFSRLEKGTLAINSRVLDWKKYVSQIVEVFQLLASQKEVKLTTKIPADLPNVLADDMRINEVLNNLINNALNYTQKGGAVEVGVKVEGQEVVTYVTDNGPGIPTEAIPHLFTKFFRVQASSSQSMSKGTGLGLYLSKLITNLHGGRIWVDTQAGKGSTFYFTLPVARV